MIPKVRLKKVWILWTLQMNSAHAADATDFRVHMGPFHWSGYLMIQKQDRVFKKPKPCAFHPCPSAESLWWHPENFLSQSLLLVPSYPTALFQSFPVEGKRLRISSHRTWKFFSVLNVVQGCKILSIDQSSNKVRWKTLNFMNPILNYYSQRKTYQISQSRGEMEKKCFKNSLSLFNLFLFITPEAFTMRPIVHKAYWDILWGPPHGASI